MIQSRMMVEEKLRAESMTFKIVTMKKSQLYCSHAEVRGLPSLMLQDNDTSMLDAVWGPVNLGRYVSVARFQIAPMISDRQ